MPITVFAVVAFAFFYTLSAALVLMVVRADGDSWGTAFALAVFWPRIFVMPVKGEG